MCQECCISIKATKYIHKYIHKGSDRSTLTIEDKNDEIKLHLDSRYISAPEAVWRLFRYEMHEEKPTVMRLQLHLPDQEPVVFEEDQDAAEVLENARNKKTTLTGYFRANQLYPEARQYLYQEFPQHYVWNKKSTKWTPRQRGFAIGRMYFAGPSSGERFFLRLLLTVVRGATSFSELRTVDDIEHATFREACIARGLLENDHEWELCLSEAAAMQTGHQLRQLFATILRENCPLQDPVALWDRFKADICDDLRNKLIQHMNIPEPTEDQIYDYGLHLIDVVLSSSGKSLEDFAPMPRPQQDWQQLGANRLIAEQLNYDRAEQQAEADARIATLNVEQRAAFDAIMKSVLEQDPQLFFLNGPGGTGKTHVYTTLCNALRAQGLIVLCVASSGIAALLLPGGRTAHSVFKIPIELWDGILCNIKKGSLLAELLKKVSLIVWDELPAQDRRAAEAVDKTMRDIRNIDRPYGGATMVYGGDWQQTLPVVVKGTREQILEVCLQRSYLWREVKVLHLTQNMRLGGPNALQEDRDFAKWLLDVGSGRATDNTFCVKLPEAMALQQNSLDCLINTIYPGLSNIPSNHHQDQFFMERTILSARNEEVDELNQKMLDPFAGEEVIFHSADTALTEEGLDNNFEYPTEFLNTVKASGLPLAKLCLKIGCPVMVLRNLDPSRGLCNGSRGILTRIQPHVLEIRLLGGDYHGTCTFIPRTTITPTAAQVGLAMKRRQFPIRLAFAMTINKSQGQSVRYVGLDLRTDVFAHGQLYVALSRCTSSQRIKALLRRADTRTASNIVYPEVLIW